MNRRLRRFVRRHRADERGAVAVTVAILMTLVLPLMCAFVLDLGMQRVGRADMQALADVVALDMARQLDGTKTVDDLTQGGADITAANKSRDRNQSVIGYAAHKPTMSVTWMKLNDHGDLVDATGTDVPTDVKVVASTEVGFGFVGFTGVASGGAQRHAIARAAKGACIKLGSFLAAIHAANGSLTSPLLSLMNGLTGRDSNLDLVAGGYQGLASANVSLADLVDTGQLHVGSVTELLSAPHVSVADLLNASATVVGGPPQNNSVAAAELSKLALLAATMPTPTISIGDLINAEPSDPAALGVSLNALDVVTGSLMLANQNHAIELNNLDLNLPAGVTSSTTLDVIEAAQPGCTNSPAHTAQVKLTATIHVPALAVPDVNLAGLGTATLGVGGLDLTLNLNLGQAVATVTGINGCDTGAATGVTADVRSSVLGDTTLSGTTSASSSVTVNLNPLNLGTLLTNLVGALGLNLLHLPTKLGFDLATTLSAYTHVSGSTFDQSVTVPVPGGYTTPQEVDGSILPSLPAASLTSGPTTTNVTEYFANGTKTVVPVPAGQTLDLLTSTLSNLTSALTTALNPIVNQVQSALVSQLSSLLGLQVGGADVYARPAPMCGAPQLVE